MLDNKTANEHFRCLSFIIISMCTCVFARVRAVCKLSRSRARARSLSLSLSHTHTHTTQESAREQSLSGVVRKNWAGDGSKQQE